MDLEIIIGIIALIFSLFAIIVSIWAIFSSKKQYKNSLEQNEKYHKETLNQNDIIFNKQITNSKIEGLENEIINSQKRKNNRNNFTNAKQVAEFHSEIDNEIKQKELGLLKLRPQMEKEKNNTELSLKNITEGDN